MLLTPALRLLLTHLPVTVSLGALLNTYSIAVFRESGGYVLAHSSQPRSSRSKFEESLFRIVVDRQGRAYQQIRKLRVFREVLIDGCARLVQSLRRIEKLPARVGYITSYSIEICARLKVVR